MIRLHTPHILPHLHTCESIFHTCLQRPTANIPCLLLLRRPVHGLNRSSSSSGLRGSSPPQSLRGDSPPGTGHLVHYGEGGDDAPTMPVVMEDSPSFVDQPGLGMPSIFPSVAAVTRAALRSPALGEMRGEEPRSLVTSPSLGRHRRAIVMGVAEASGYLEEGNLISSHHGAGTEEFHRRFTIAADLDDSSRGGQTLLVSSRPRRPPGGNTSRESCVGGSVFGDGGTAGRSPLGPSGAGSLANSMTLSLLSSGGMGSSYWGYGLVPPLDIVAAAAAAAAASVSVCLPPTRLNLALRSVGGGSFTRNSAASSVGNADEYDRVCGVCLDVGDFIATLTCNHKICGG